MDKQKNEKKRSLQKSDYLFIVLTIVIVLFSYKYIKCTIVGHRNQMQKFELYDLDRFEFPGVEKVTLEILKQKFEEYNWPKLQDFNIAIISSVVLYFAHQALHAITYDFWLKNIKEKKSKEVDHMRALKCVQNTFKMLFMIFSSVIGTIAFYGNDYQPWWWLGFNMNAGCANSYKNYPLLERSYFVQVYIMINMGYRLMKTYQDIFETKKQNDFFQQMLHHAIVIMLFIGNYYMNFVTSGMVIVYAFDTTDVWVCASRLSSELRHQVGIKVFSILMLISWWYVRIICFPIMYYLNFKYYPSQVIPNWDQRPDEQFVMDCQLYLSFFLHILCIYWGYQILMLIIKFTKTGESVDTINKTE